MLRQDWIRRRGHHRIERGVSLRSRFSFAIVAAALAGSAYGAAAQYYPPPDYPPAPVPVYRDGPPPVYRDSRGVPIDPRYVQPAPGEEVYVGPPVGRSFFPPQPMPVVTGGPIDRPPGDVAGISGSTDVTGSFRGAPPAAAPGYAPGGASPGKRPRRHSGRRRARRGRRRSRSGRPRGGRPAAAGPLPRWQPQ